MGIESGKRWEVSNGTAWLEACCRSSLTGLDQFVAEVNVSKGAQKVLRSAYSVVFERTVVEAGVDGGRPGSGFANDKASRASLFDVRWKTTSEANLRKQ